VNWPARSSDFNLLEFRLWRHLKTLVYSVPINDSKVQQQLVESSRHESRVKPGILGRERTSVVRRKAENCVEIHGNHTEQHLL
jgi:hypothetical protein